MFYIRGMENIAAFQASAGPQNAASTTYTGASLNMGASTDDNIYLAQSVGAVSGTLPTLAGNVQQLNAAGSWVSCNPILSAPTTVTASNNIQVVGFMRDFQWVRYVGTIGGTLPQFTFDAVIYGQVKKI